MGAMTSAGTFLGITASAPATFDETGFEALTYTEIGEVTDIGGDIGRVYALVTQQPLKTRATRKFKGSFNSGNMTLQLALDRDDAGQVLAKAALLSDNDYSFCLTLQDGSKTYVRGKVMSFPINVGSVDSITTATITIEITSDDDGNDFVEAES